MKYPRNVFYSPWAIFLTNRGTRFSLPLPFPLSSFLFFSLSLSTFFYSHSGLPPFGYRLSSLSSRTKKFPPSSNGINIHASAIISLAGDFSSIYSDARFKIWLNRRGTIRSDKALQITQWRFVFLMGRKESRKVTLFIKDSLSLSLSRFSFEPFPRCSFNPYLA